MRKIIFVGHRDMYFGAEAVMLKVLNIVNRERLGIPIVILPTSRSDEFSKHLKSEGIDSVQRANFKLINGSFVRSVLCVIYNVLANLGIFLRLLKEDVKLVYTNTSVNIFGALLAWALQKPHIWHFHEQPTGSEFKWIPRLLFPLYIYLIRRRDTKLIFISKCQKDLWEIEFGVTIHNFEIIYSPPLSVSDETFVASIDRTVRVGFLGSFSTSKNIFSLLRSFSVVKKKHLHVPLKLFLMGDGELKSDISRAIQELNISESVSIMQHSRDITSFFSSIDIFVLPSYFESWGLVVLEAMSFRKAVICTENTGLKEILTRDQDCIFVDPLENDHLSDALETLVLNKSFRESLASNAYQSFKRLNLEDRFQASIRSIF